MILRLRELSWRLFGWPSPTCEVKPSMYRQALEREKERIRQRDQRRETDVRVLQVYTDYVQLPTEGRSQHGQR